ncbi:MAG: 4Fe-4S cluster-binding domain-containing protein [Candidatus Aenigmarchaeota archaeon]|nr:4Fe-4S cluster-binding domain-containing protein [Candidatus Aenigmarchaeota archaeon]
MAVSLDHRYKALDGDLLLTVACPVECDFCVYSCTAPKEESKWMPTETIERVAEQYSKNGIAVRISGGEPFYDREKLEACIDILLKHYQPLQIQIITSGFFAINEKQTTLNLKLLKRKKLNTLIVSSDRFHLKRVPLSNIENILKVAEKINIDIVLRITLDGESFHLLDNLARLITIYKPSMEVHRWDVVGRAETIDISPLKKTEEARKFFFKKIEEYAKIHNAPRDIRYYLTHSAKRSQLIYAPIFFPTTFPNGDVYGCSMTMKGCYLGNINNEDLLDMMIRWKKTLPGNFVLSTSTCNEILKFLPEKYRDDVCEFCRNIPLSGVPTKSIGRIYLKLEMNSNFEDVIKNMNNKREYLISFALKEKDLHTSTGSRIADFLEELKQKRIRYKLSRPLPKCLGIKTDKTHPQNCYECIELFTVIDGKIKFCEPFKEIEGQELEYAKDRKQIYEYFCYQKNKFEKLEKCKSCLYFLRKVCDGLCFVGNSKKLQS